MPFKPTVICWCSWRGCRSCRIPINVWYKWRSDLFRLRNWLLWTWHDGRFIYWNENEAIIKKLIISFCYQSKCWYIVKWLFLLFKLSKTKSQAQKIIKTSAVCRDGEKQPRQLIDGRLLIDSIHSEINQCQI